MGLAACLGHGAKMPGLRFYNQRSRHEHSISTPPLETSCQAPWVTPRGLASRPFPGTRGVATSISGPAPDHLAVIRPPAAACLTARPPASVRSTFRTDARAPSGESSGAFSAHRTPCRSIPLAPLLGRPSASPASGSASNRLARAHRGRVNAGGYAETEVPSIARGRSGRSCESPSRRSAPAGRPAQRPRVFTGVQCHRLDLSSCRFRRTNRGRARPYDFCRWISPRARPRTTRTSRSAETAVGTTAWARTEVAFRIEAAARGAQGQGSGLPMPDIPGRDCSRRRLRPNPDRSGHLLSRDAALHRSGATR